MSGSGTQLAWVHAADVASPTSNEVIPEHASTPPQGACGEITLGRAFTRPASGVVASTCQLDVDDSEDSRAAHPATPDRPTRRIASAASPLGGSWQVPPKADGFEPSIS